MIGFFILIVYAIIFCAGLFIYSKLLRRYFLREDFTSLKTVTFGDESAVVANRMASVLSVITVFLIWAAFTNSGLPMVKIADPFAGQAQFTYTMQAPDGTRDEATVTVLVYREDIQQLRDEDGNVLQAPGAPEVDPGTGFARNDSITMKRYAGKNINVWENDEYSKEDGAQVIAINGGAD